MIKINKQTVAFKTSTVMLSKIISATISLIFVPVYIKLLGVESYGLVAFYLLLMGVLAVIDLALSTSLSRQLVILRTNKEPEKSIKDLVFSVEIIYAIISLFIVAGIYLLANIISTHWLKTSEIPVDRLRNSIKFIGVLVALQFPTSIYNGVMVSIDKQVLNSVITIVVNILKAIGVIAVLKIFSPIIENYFIWQIFITLCALLTLRYFVWEEISISKIKANFSYLQLSPIKSFSIGMIGVSLVNFSLSMVDKLIVSKSVPLNLVTCYSLAFQVAAVIGQIVAPLQSTIFPKFTEFLTNNNWEPCVKLYHKACRWVAICVLPIGIGLFFFAKDILLVWSKNEFIVANTTPVLQVVTIGTVCNCLMFVPYIFMLSKGKTKFTIIQNIIGAMLFLPMLYWAIPKYGILGASFMWLGINVSYVLFSIPLFHRLYMKNELSNWYLKDNFSPFIVSFFIIGAAKLIRINIVYFQSNIPFIGLVFVLAIGYVYTIPELRKLAFNILKTTNK